MAQKVEQRKGDWMQTFTGVAFWPMDPRPEEVNIEDIAHALSMQCRYAGHANRFYSVAEHSVIVARHVAPEHKLYALLHDASEAYLVDVPRPVKPHLKGYKAAEKRVQDVIAERFGVRKTMPAEVKDIDDRILVDEMSQLMPNPPMDWGHEGPAVGASLHMWQPKVAALAFMTTFNKLYTDA